MNESDCALAIGLIESGSRPSKTGRPFARYKNDPAQQKRAIRLLVFPLDFPPGWSVCGVERTPWTEVLEATLKTHFVEMRQRLDRAAGIAKAAEACAQAGNIETAIEITLDIELLIYEVTTFLNAACMIHRINKT